MAHFRIETQVVNMDFFRLNEFQSSHMGAAVEFSPVADYRDVWRRIHFDNSFRGSHVATGNVTVYIEAAGPQEALESAAKLLSDYEHLLVLAHYHDVFFTELSCFEQHSDQMIATKDPGGRRGEAGSGCLLWAEFIPQFLAAALPRLDRVLGFRWALYWYNEVTAISPSLVPEIEIPSLWTAFEVIAGRTATASGKDILLSDKHIGELKNRFRPILIEMGFDETVRGQIYSHLKTLSRPAILYLARDFLGARGLGQYASEVESFYELRNDIVHGRSLRYSHHTVVKRMFRFRRLLQKLFFSVAGVYSTPEIFRAPVESPDLSAI